MKKAILLGCNITGLGVIRSLAKENVKIMAVPIYDSDIAHFSRFVSAKTNVMDIRKYRGKLLECLLRLEDKWNGALIISTSDDAITFVTEYRKELESRYVLSIQDSFTLHSLLDKGSLYRHASKNHLPLPRFFFPESLDHMKKKKNDITYPCILKPCDSHIFGSIFGKKLEIIKNFKGLVEIYKETQRYNLRVMVVEIIPGDDECLYHYRSYIDRRGDIVADMCTQKIRQSPPGFGVARMSKTVPMISELKELTLTLLKSVSYHGFSSAEFKYDYRDKKYKLMEINLRPVMPERLFFYAGINFPYITYMDCVEGVSLKTQNYETGLYWISNFADIIQYIKGRKENGYTIREYFRPYLNKKTYSLPFFEDPMPFIVSALSLLKHKIGRRNNNSSI